MGAHIARHATSTALAAAVLLLVAPGAIAAPPSCADEQPPYEVETGKQLFIFPDCADPDADDELSFRIITRPAHGTANGGFGPIGYTATAPYTGPDQIEFAATDGTDTTSPVTVDITVVENPPPVCSTPITLRVDPDQSVLVFPFETCDDFPASARIVAAPAHGVVPEYDPELGAFVYTPEPGFVGTDEFRFVINDGASDSNPVTVKVTVGRNKPPTCVTPISIIVARNGNVLLDHRTACSDPDEDTIFPELVQGPSHGELEIDFPAMTYRPHQDYTGPDLILFRVRDDRGATSNLATLKITVGTGGTVVNPSPDQIPPVVGLAGDGKQKLKAVRRNGLKLKVATDEAGLAQLSVWVSKRTARKLRIRPKATGPVRIGWLTRTIDAGESRLTVELGRKARKRLARARKVKLTVAARVIDLADNVGTDTLKMTLRR